MKLLILYTVQLQGSRYIYIYVILCYIHIYIYMTIYNIIVIVINVTVACVRGCAASVGLLVTGKEKKGDVRGGGGELVSYISG